MTDPPPLLSLEHVSLERAGRFLVEDVSLRVAVGEVVTLIGPNGAGKTTTVRLALGLEEPSRGTVTRAPGVVVGYVPQRLAVDRAMPLTVDTMLHMTPGLDRCALKRWRGEAGVESLGDASVHRLSGGELQRVLLTRALARNPDLLVLDEPTQNMDVPGQAALYALIRKARDALGCGVLMVSHDLHVVMAATDHVICLNGHVCCHGSPEHVRRNPVYEQLFGPLGQDMAIYAHGGHDHAHGLEDHVHHHGHDHGGAAP